MKIQFLSILLISVSTAFSQGESNNWYFGENAGLNFSTSTPTVLNDGQTFCREGVAVASDSAGSLLFYSDGVSVWNKNHNTIPNGTGLNGHVSSTQSAIIVKQPGANSKWYIFTTPDKDASSVGFRYSIIDMSLDNGNGAVVAGSKNVLIDNNTAEKVCYIQSNKDTLWIIHHQWNNNTFKAYLLTAQGIQSPVVSNVGGIVGGNIANSVGYLKASPSGNRIAMCVMDYTYDNPSNKRVEVFNFSKSTGQISSPLVLQSPAVSSNGAGYYGVEFSPNESYLYVSHIIPGAVYQYNLSLPTPLQIENSRLQLLYDENIYYGALQLAPNGKIYVAKEYQTTLDVINQPDVLGSGCDYQINGQSLGINQSRLGLPVFPYQRKPQNSSVENIESTLQIMLFPNPSSGVLFVSAGQFETNNIKIQVVDINGKILIEQMVFKNENEIFPIDVSELAQGCYFLKINNENIFQKNFRFIKQ